MGSTNADSGGFFPYGEDKGTVGANDSWKFATYWRDSVSGLDYAVNRYYSSTLGRFLTPDPYSANTGGPGDPASPYSWNHYLYGADDPVGNTDPFGTTTCDANGNNCYDSVTVSATLSASVASISGNRGGGNYSTVYYSLDPLPFDRSPTDSHDPQSS